MSVTTLGLISLEGFLRDKLTANDFEEVQKRIKFLKYCVNALEYSV